MALKYQPDAIAYGGTRSTDARIRNVNEANRLRRAWVADHLVPKLREHAGAADEETLLVWLLDFDDEDLPPSTRVIDSRYKERTNQQRLRDAVKTAPSTVRLKISRDGGAVYSLAPGLA